MGKINQNTMTKLFEMIVTGWVSGEGGGEAVVSFKMFGFRRVFRKLYVKHVCYIREFLHCKTLKQKDGKKQV